jgi:hypothetical protein
LQLFRESSQKDGEGFKLTCVVLAEAFGVTAENDLARVLNLLDQFKSTTLITAHPPSLGVKRE